MNLPKISKQLVSASALTFTIIICDQLTKYWALQHLEHFKSVACLPVLNWTLNYNQGAAFGFLANYGGVQRWFLLAMTLVICGFIMVKIKQSQYQADKSAEIFALALILGGALGNFIDRLRFGYVIDFIDCYFRAWHWYTFNVADIAICVGVALYFFTAKD